ncbi:uncharacterized protein [Procambarus clarkii]|uniref:uncharacterized protein isoform X2 n=1 Tax=Procambarus clarkii TaxID=6728 RepID=UPI001E675D9C|nr:uncharacterized protein LOC123747571 isoform X2 [Procambarus clarkii]
MVLFYLRVEGSINGAPVTYFTPEDRDTPGWLTFAPHPMRKPKKARFLYQAGAARIFYHKHQGLIWEVCVLRGLEHH